MKTYVNADKKIHIQIYNDEYEEFIVLEQTIAECLDSYTDEGCPEPVDVAPIIHGHWYFDETDYITKCSACGRGKWKGYIPSVEEATQWMPFCPQCGARMDEKEFEVRI